ncbi:MAG: type VI secretion system tip protein VgrG [Acidobacteriota bacterium]
MPVVTPTVLSQGAVIAPEFQIRSVDIRREVNRIPRAEIVLADGDAARRVFAASDATEFEPGKQIEIKLRWEGETDDATVFKGWVVRHGVEAGTRGTVLVVEAKDAAVKLTGPRKSAVHRDKTDSDVIGDLIDAAKLTRGELAATGVVHPELVQFQTTDWDFILSRAEANGLLVATTDGEISVRKIASLESQRAAHAFEWGIDQILSFEMVADAGHQFDTVESVAWDPKNQQLTAVKKAAAFQPSQGDLDGADLGDALGFTTDTLSHPVALTAGELQAWADGTLARRRMALLRGRLTTVGFANLALLDVIEVAGIGKRFNGKTVVTGLRHRVDADGWRTDLAFGLPPEGWFERLEHAASPPAAGLLPPVPGLQIGVVASFEDDPERDMRIKVLLPAVDPAKEAVWARLMAPDAGAGRGLVFRPEVGDEVVVGFLNDDPRHPVILGSLHSSTHPPPTPFAQPTAENIEKGIVTRSGTTLVFLDEDKPSVRIETAAGNKIVVDDRGERIELADQHGNAVILSKDGVSLESGKDILINATDNVEIKGSKVDIS